MVVEVSQLQKFYKNCFNTVTVWLNMQINGILVGLEFGRRHYIKEPKVSEAIKTGKQGKFFYERLKKVGLLEE